MDLSLPTVMSVCDTIDSLQREHAAMDPVKMTAAVRSVYANQGVPLAEHLLQRAVELHCLGEPCESVIPVNAPQIPVAFTLDRADSTFSSSCYETAQTTCQDTSGAHEYPTRHGAVTSMETMDSSQWGHHQVSQAQPKQILWKKRWRQAAEWVPIVSVVGLMAGAIVAVVWVIAFSFSRSALAKEGVPVLVNEVATQSTAHAQTTLQGELWHKNAMSGNVSITDVNGRPDIRWGKAVGEACYTVIDMAQTHPDKFAHVALSIDGRALDTPLDLKNFSCQARDAQFDIVLAPR